MNYLVSENHLEPHVRVRKWFYRIAFWVLALVLLFALVRQANWKLTYLLLLDIPLVTLFICGGIWVLSFVFRALRFQSEWKKFGRIPLLAALRATVLHNAAVVLVPFRVGELGYPVLVRELIKVPWQQCIRSLMWLRFQDGVVLITMALLILPFINIEIRLFILCLFVLTFFGTRRWWLGLLRSRHFLSRQLRAFLHQRSDGWGWLWSISNWVSKLFVVSLLIQSLTNLEILRTLKGALTGELSALLPLTGPAGFGTYEIGVWSGLGLPWSQMSQLMASILLTHLFFLMISLVFALVFLVLDSLNDVSFKSLNRKTNV
jgi:hypothetical protein